MAERRMFSKTIIDSDAFLDMPASTQNLYFHLSMRADDDGFVNGPKKIQRIVNASDDDMRILLSKRFILAFESGVIVIKHWRMHNYLRADRYKPTVYQAEIAQLSVKENGAYTLNPVYQPATSGIPTGNQPATQVRLGKDSIGEDREEEMARASYFTVNGKTAEPIQEARAQTPSEIPRYPEMVFQEWAALGGKVFQPSSLFQFLQTWNRDISQFVRGVHSDDVLAAIRNLGIIVSAPSGTYYWKYRIGIAGFMAKHLEKFLPANFNVADFAPTLSYKGQEEAETAAAVKRVFGKEEEAS